MRKSIKVEINKTKLCFHTLSIPSFMLAINSLANAASSCSQLNFFINTFPKKPRDKYVGTG